MTKAQSRDVAMIRAYHATGNLHAAAAGLSALIRCAMSGRQAAQLRAIAAELGLTSHPAYIV